MQGSESTGPTASAAAQTDIVRCDQPCGGHPRRRQRLDNANGNAPAPAGGPPTGQQPAGAPIWKKARIYSRGRFLHALFPQQPPNHVDRLAKLYPHQRDPDIYMDEKLHKYFVSGQEYPLSVSGWWNKFFSDFEPTGVSEAIVRRQLDTPGFRTCSGEVTAATLASSVYNFAQRIRILERHDDEEYLDALWSVASTAVATYASRGVCCPFSVECIVEQGRPFLTDPQKPDGPSCYYLVLLYTAARRPDQQAADIARTWDLNGGL